MKLPALFLFLLLALPQILLADACRLETREDALRARAVLGNHPFLVTVCPHCENTDPVPLRVQNFELVHISPNSVPLVFYDLSFPVEALIEAEQSGTGPLAGALREQIEKEYADGTGYLPNDPILIKEKRDRFAMMLRFAREDLELRTWDELLINGEPVNPALLYYPTGGNRYQSLGTEVGCELYSGAPFEVTYRPVDRKPELEAPPAPFIADITGQCYDGSCPAEVWTVRQPVPYFERPDGEKLGLFEAHEKLRPLQTQAHVSGGRALASRDRGRIFAGDVFYLLDSQGEGFYRIWHYGDVFIEDGEGILHNAEVDRCARDGTCWAELLDYPTNVWWAQVQGEKGEIGWVREPLEAISGVLTD